LYNFQQLRKWSKMNKIFHYREFTEWYLLHPVFHVELIGLTFLLIKSLFICMSKVEEGEFAWFDRITIVCGFTGNKDMVLLILSLSLSIYIYMYIYTHTQNIKYNMCMALIQEQKNSAPKT
jgi:hypothetical protein